MKTKFDLGVTLKPTKEGIKTFLVKEGEYAISLGKRKDGFLALVRVGKRTIEGWSKSCWEVLKK